MNKQKIKQEIIEQSEFKDYLEIESLINLFFTKINFCIPNCITQKRRLESPAIVSGYIACCNDAFYNNNHLQNIPSEFTTERIKIYGKPETEQEVRHSICGYHTKNGCLLKTHKSPVCISFACKPLNEFLSNIFGIEYNYLQNKNKMNDILNTSEDKKDEEYHKKVSDLKSTIQNYIRIVDEKNNNKF